MAEAQQMDGQVGGTGDETLQLDAAIAKFIPAVSHYQRTLFKKDLPEQAKFGFRNVFGAWNIFLAMKQGGQHTAALVSQDIRNDREAFISKSQSIPSDDEAWIRDWLTYWNSFLLAQKGESPVTKWGVFLTALGALLYAVDMATDLGTAVYFACSGHWWRCALTLLIVYATVAISTARLLLAGAVLCNSPLERLRYFVFLLVNWPDLQSCCRMLHAEWKLIRSPRSSAHLVPVWQWSRARVAELKLTEGLCEACPQALLQLMLLLPELQGNITGTVSMRMMSTAISLCTAGAALVNREKANRFAEHTALPLAELIVLLVWAVPVTACRVLCLALLLSVHLYWGLACMALHLTLYAMYWGYTRRVPRAHNEWLDMCLSNILFLVSPFNNFVTCRSRVVRHGIHFLGNAVVTVLWALTTSLHCTQPALYTTIISSIFVMFLIGLLGWLLHWKHWPMYLKQ